MNKLFLLLILLLAQAYSYSQETLINGKISNQDNQEAVPFSTVEIPKLQMGTVVNAEGLFSLEVPDEHLNDSILVKSLGFYDTLISIRSLLNTDTAQVLIRPQAYELVDIEVKPRKEFATLGADIENANTGYVLVRWMQVAMYMANDERDPAFLKSASFYIGKNPEPKTPFRIRIYAAKEDGSPGKDLLQESVIVAGKKASDWIEIDLSTYGIRFPETGLFVAMEWILSDQKYYYTEKVGDRKFRFYGQKLGNALIPVEEQQTWIYRLGSNWKFDDKVFEIKGEKYGRNALIKCELQFLE